MHGVFVTIWMLYGEWDPKEYFLGLNVSFEIDKCVVKYSLKWTKLRNPLGVERVAESLLTIKVVQNKPQKLCHFSMQTILSLKAIKTKQIQEKLLPSFNCLKNLDRRCGPERKITLSEWSVWQDKHIITKHLLFLTFCLLFSSPLKPQCPSYFLAQGGI